MHCITIDYPKRPKIGDRNKMRKFFDTVKDILPCQDCQKSFKRLLIKYPITLRVLANRKTLVLWLIKIHNLTNKEVGVPEVTAEQVLKEFKMKVPDL